MEEKLIKALETMIAAASEAQTHWDADRNAKLGKLLLAMAGHLKEYRKDLTKVHRLLDEVKNGQARPAGPTVESPTWGQVKRMADVVFINLGGPEGAANKLSYESYYTLSILVSLNLDKAKSKEFILGRKYLGSEE